MSVLTADDRAVVSRAVEKIGGGGSKGPQPRVVSRARPESTRKGGLAPSPVRVRHCPWCGYAIRGLAPACEQCIDLEAALHENTEPGVTFHGAAPGSDTKGL